MIDNLDASNDWPISIDTSRSTHLDRQVNMCRVNHHQNVSMEMGQSLSIKIGILTCRSTHVVVSILIDTCSSTKSIDWHIFIDKSTCAPTHRSHPIARITAWLTRHMLTCRSTCVNLDWHMSIDKEYWLTYLHRHVLIDTSSLTRQHVSGQSRRNSCYGVAAMSRRLKIIGLSCKRALQTRRYSAKETYHFKEPTNRCHSIHLNFNLETVHSQPTVSSTVECLSGND